MIVRDEEEFIEDCLRAARPAVDEVVVVDTGSQDRTVEIARGFGAKIVHFPWNDDFSAARNRGLEAAAGDWILSLDADEILDISDADALRRAANQGLHSGFFMPVVSRLDAERLSTCMMMRFFVNRAEIRYRFLIHEQILPDLIHYARRIGKRIGHLDLKIDHKGYEPELMDRRDKKERNDRIFRKQLQLYPRDLYSWYKYAEFLAFVNEDREKLQQTLWQAHTLMRALPIANLRSMPFAGEIGAYLAIELFEDKGDPEQALKVLRDCANRALPTPHLYFVLAEIERKQGRFREALAAYERCMAFEGQDLMVSVKDGVIGWESLLGMGLCLMELHEPGKAQERFKQSLQCSPGQVDPYVGLAQTAYREGDLQQALEWLTKLLAVHPDCVQAWQTGSDLLMRLGLQDKAAQ